MPRLPSEQRVMRIIRLEVEAIMSTVRSICPRFLSKIDRFEAHDVATLVQLYVVFETVYVVFETVYVHEGINSTCKSGNPFSQNRTPIAFLHRDIECIIVPILPLH